MIYLAVIFLFAIASAIPSGREDVVFPSVETSRSGVKTVKFRALNEDIELKLEPAGDILAKNFAIVDQQPNPIDVEDLKRRIYRDSTNGAALLIDEDGPVTIQGIVNSKFRIEPYELGPSIFNGRTVKDVQIPHKIVEVINDEKSFLNDAVMHMDVNEEMEKVATMARDDQCIVVECLVVTESAFTKRFETTKALTEYVTVMYTGVQNLIDTLQLGIKVRLLGIDPFKKDTEPPYIEESVIPGHPEYFNPYDLLDGMGKYYCNHATGLAKDADIIMLFITRKLGELQDDGTVVFVAKGVAYTGTVCNECYKVGISLDDSRYKERVETVAHEIAHLLGSLHDGESSDVGLPVGTPGALDCPVTDGYMMGDRSNLFNRYKFSECSKNCVKYALSLAEAKCVYESCGFQ
ncbi:venom metalloproteinase antarease-like TtrivMP_A [Centruroides sculpturatus]|uniref:venom metalloproteinase antarease-like TtrivMP_A n=1 Tax=Centruroides sculpturatus TaxID=218467 RepID=UPI000C6E0606|nr:venom metalloproteinase antarease-like TtrivMP_A [Centruroides sculpturatus]